MSDTLIPDGIADGILERDDALPDALHQHRMQGGTNHAVHLGTTTTSEFVKAKSREALLEEMVDAYEEVEQMRKVGGLYFFKPLPKQDDFLRAHRDHKVIAYFGGNRSGKTHGGAVSIVAAAIGQHKYWQIPRKKKLFWVVSLDYKQARRTTIQKILELMPHKYQKKWYEHDKILRLVDGTEIDFKSAELGREHFQGAELDGIWLDEENPYAIYQECYARTIDRRGKILITETPLKGMTWVYSDIYMKSHMNGGPDRDIAVIQTNVHENINLPSDEIDKWEASLSEDERKMRIEGKFISLTGFIFGSELANTDPVLKEGFQVPHHWKRARAIDVGARNPTAAVWGAVSEDGIVYIYDEYQQPGRTTGYHAQEIHKRSPSWSGRTLIDPSAAQWKLDLQDHKITCEDADNDVFAGIMRLKGLLDTGKIRIFPHCKMLIHQLKQYQWDAGGRREDRDKPEKPRKKDDHLVDAARYLVMGMRGISSAELKDRPQPGTWGHLLRQHRTEERRKKRFGTRQWKREAARRYRRY